MALNPKLEFFRFEIKHKDKIFKTFKDLSFDLLNVDVNQPNNKIMQEMFSYFIKSLDSDLSLDEKQKKRIALVKDDKVNKYLHFQPKLNSNNYTISGVINGGDYGRDRILTRNNNINDSSGMNSNDSVLQYFYFNLYIPLDHNEGCFILHSNSIGESITKVFRTFISKIFRHEDYFKIEPELFTPKSFQDEFKTESLIQNISFRNSFVDNIPNTEGVGSSLDEYDIIIKVIPKNKNISISKVDHLKKTFSKFSLFRGVQKEVISDFNETKFEVRNPTSKTNKTFEWNKKDNEFSPVVYLDGRMEKFNLDGTPDFEELSILCQNLLQNEVLPELRPDFNVKRIN